VPVWHDAQLSPLSTAAFLDLAVFWDKDHDTRIIELLERLYFKGLLSPIKFIGERKGTLTVFVTSEGRSSKSNLWLQEYSDKIREICRDVSGDQWPVTVYFYSGSEDDVVIDYDDQSRIINDSEEHIRTYLKNIDMLWSLGIKPIPSGAEYRAGGRSSTKEQKWDTKRVACSSAA